MPKRYYIAYGSNLNVEQMKHRCPDARVVGTAALDGWTLLFKGSKTGSYLTIEPKEGESVPVAVWEVSERDELRLDHYEGYPTFYYKKDMKISYTGIASGKLRKKKAFVYIMHEDRPLGHPSDYYLKVCARGYRFFGFDINRLMQAVYDSRRMTYENAHRSQNFRRVPPLRELLQLSPGTLKSRRNRLYLPRLRHS